MTREGELPEDAQSPAFWLAFLLSALGLAFKAPDSLTLPQFWAEDGQIFFAEQHGHLWPLLFKSHGTYLNVVPRFIAWIASFFPAVLAPTFYCFSAWIIGALALVSLRQLRLAGLPYFVLLAGIIFAPTNGEIFGTLANVQWLFQFFLLGSLARLARGDVARAPWLRIVLTLLVGLTGPFCMFAAGAGVSLVALSLLAKRVGISEAAPIRWNGELTAIVLTAGAQALCIATSDESNLDGAGPATVGGAAHLLALTQLHSFVAAPLPTPLFALLFIVLLLAPWFSIRDRSTRYVLLSAYGFVALQGAAFLRKFAGQSDSLSVFGNADRYYFVFKTLLFWLLALCVWRAARRNIHVQHALMVILILTPLPWSWPYLQRPALPNLHWKRRAAQIDAGRGAVIDISPRPWKLRIERAQTQD